MEENDEELLKRIVDLLVAGGYSRARISSLPPFDKLAGGLAWCITASDVDVDHDIFYNNDATLDHKIKGCKAIESALQKLECPHPLQGHQIQGLDYRAVYPVVEWLVRHVMVDCEMLPNQVFSYAARKSFKAAGSELMDHRIGLCTEELQRDASYPPLLSRNAQAGQQDKEEQKSKLLSDMNALEKRVEQAGMAELSQLLMEKCTISEEELDLHVHFESEHGAQLETVNRLESQKQVSRGSRDQNAEIEEILQEDQLKLKLLKEEMAKKNWKFMSYRRQLDEIPSPTELMQYERGFVQLYLQMQAKLQETRRYYANYNALAEANELTEKEISLLNSISVQFQEGVTSQAARAKFVTSMSDIAKGVHQKVEKMQARLLQEQRVLSGLTETHDRVAAERRRYVNFMKALQEECAKNEELQILERQRVASSVAIK